MGKRGLIHEFSVVGVALDGKLVEFELSECRIDQVAFKNWRHSRMNDWRWADWAFNLGRADQYSASDSKWRIQDSFAMRN